MNTTGNIVLVEENNVDKKQVEDGDETVREEDGPVEMEVDANEKDSENLKSQELRIQSNKMKCAIQRLCIDLLICDQQWSLLENSFLHQFMDSNIKIIKGMY